MADKSFYQAMQFHGIVKAKGEGLPMSVIEKVWKNIRPGASTAEMRCAFAAASPSTVIVIEDSDEERTRWGVSFDGPNPEPDFYVECASEGDAWKLKELIERRDSLLA